MIDITTQKPLRVVTGGTGYRARSYLIVPARQVPAVRNVLSQAGIDYWVDELEISVDGRPAVTFVNFAREVNPKEVQDELDRVA